MINWNFKYLFTKQYYMPQTKDQQRKHLFKCILGDLIVGGSELTNEEILEIANGAIQSFKERYNVKVKK